MSNGKKIVKNIFSLSIAEFASKGLQAFFYLYLARILGKEGLGALGFAQSFTAYFILFVKLGFDTVGTRVVAQSYDKIRKIVNTVISIRTILAFSVFGILLFSTFVLLNPLSTEKFSMTDKLIIIIAGLNIFSFAYLLNWVYIGLEKMKVIAIRTVLISFSNFLGVLLFVRKPDDVIFAISIMVVSNIATTIYLYMYYKKQYGNVRWDYDKEYWRSISKQSATIGLTFLIITIYNNLDITMIRLLHGEAETGIYEAAHRIFLLTIVFSSIIQGAFFPQISRLTGKELDITLERFNKILFWLGASLGFFIFVFADYLVILISDEYLDSVGVLKVLSSTTILVFINISFFVPLIAWGKENKVFWGNLTGLIFNAILNFTLIPKYGAIGAAIATISTEIGVMIYTSYLFYKIRHTIDIKNFAKAIAVSGISFLPGLYFIKIGINPIINIVICVILLFILTFVFKIISFKELKAVIKR